MVGIALTVTVDKAVFVQPTALVPVTLYVVVVLGLTNAAPLEYT